MKRSICIHGHFYQPPRENPWLESIERQGSAHPYHDWNERVTAECYRPNAESRILGTAGSIERIVNNYASISFDFGPTLLSWLEPHAPDVYRAILAADRESCDRFGGHGSAIAQAYGHTILPLSTREDKATQIRWGIRDFQRRFGRRPEGLWLPEAAVDLESLDLLAAEGVAFTILAPHQALRVRRLDERRWEDVTGARIDPTRAYQVRLPSGRAIAVFFYDGPVSRAIAFEALLSSGERFAGRLLSVASDPARTWHPLVHVATDGETYGHHHRHGEMALAYALRWIEERGLARVTNYGRFLEEHPPGHEVEIVENTSWSCAHGVERWRSDCGCRTGRSPGADQAWRGPLREAFDWLRDRIRPLFERRAVQVFADPWGARDDFIELLHDRSEASVDRFLGRHATGPFEAVDRSTALRLLELQRQAMQMYTSCGWFFDDLSGIETVQVVEHAGRAVHLAEDLFGEPLEADFLTRLGRARSSLPEGHDGRSLYERRVRPKRVDLAAAAAHYAIGSLFGGAAPRRDIYCWTCEREAAIERHAGRAKLLLGRVRVTSASTLERDLMSWAALHLGDHNLTAGVRRFTGEESFARMVAEIGGAFGRGSLTETIRLIDRHFGASVYSVGSLFADEQARIVSKILESTLAEFELAHRRVYEAHRPLLAFLRDVGTALPPAFLASAGVVLELDLRRLLEARPIDVDRVESVLDDARAWDAPLDRPGLALAFQRALEDLAADLESHPSDVERLDRFSAAVDLARRSDLEVDLACVQNVVYGLRRRDDRFARLAKQLSIRTADRPLSSDHVLL